MQVRRVSFRVLGLFHLLASFPGLPHFYFLFAFTIIHGSGRPVKNFRSCVLLWTQTEGKNGGGLTILHCPHLSLSPLPPWEGVGLGMRLPPASFQDSSHTEFISSLLYSDGRRYVTMSETGHTHLRYYVNVCTCGNNDTGDLNALSFLLMKIIRLLAQRR